MNLNQITKLIQDSVGVTADGIYGINTAKAIASKLGLETEEKETEEKEREGFNASDLLDPEKNRSSYPLLVRCMVLNIVNLEDPKCVDPNTMRVHRLPAADRGGKWEVAGLSDGYEPEVVDFIRKEIEAGRRQSAWSSMIHSIDEKSITESIEAEMEFLDCHAIQYRFRSFAFNAGISASIKCLQRALNTFLQSPIATDGKWGKNTAKALGDVLTEYGEKKVLLQFNLKIQDYYKSLRQYKNGTFKKGWECRWTEDEKIAENFLDLNW